MKIKKYFYYEIQNISEIKDFRYKGYLIKMKEPKCTLQGKVSDVKKLKKTST